MIVDKSIFYQRFSSNSQTLVESIGCLAGTAITFQADFHLVLIQHSNARLTDRCCISSVVMTKLQE